MIFHYPSGQKIFLEKGHAGPGLKRLSPRSIFLFPISIPPPPPVLRFHAQFVNLTRTIMRVSRGESRRLATDPTLEYRSIEFEALKSDGFGGPRSEERRV